MTLAVSVDGEPVAPEAATISIFDRGFLYGDGLFEVLRTWNGELALLDDHLDRLEASAHALDLAIARRDDLARWVRDTALRAGPGEQRVRVVVTRGPGSLGARLASIRGGRTFVVVEPLPPQATELSLAIVDWPLPPRRGRTHKSLSFLDHLVARDLAAAAGADEALRLHADGRVAECATATIFAVIAGEVVTPRCRGILPGVTRARVLELCGREDIRAHERDLTVAELVAADEIFATSALRGVVPVTHLDGTLRSAGPITRRLATSFVHALGRSRL